MKEKKVVKTMVANDKIQENLEQNEIPETQKILYNTTVSNWTKCGRAGNGKYSCSIPVGLLKIDPAYQRADTTTDVKLRKLANHFTEDKLMPIIVVPHPEEFCFYIVDGYHRFTVVTTMLDVKYKELDAIVLTNVSKDPVKRQIFEAELFVGQATEVDKISPVQMHNARLVLKDPTAVGLQELLNKYNISYSSKRGQRQSAVIGSYSMAYNIVKTNGKECLDFILSIVDNAGWKEERNGLSKIIMNNIREVWCAYPTSEEHDKMHDYYSSKLRNITPELLYSYTRAKYPMRNEEQSVRLYLSDLLVEDLGFEKSTYFEREEKKSQRRIAG